MLVIIFQGCTFAVNKHIDIFYYLNCNAHKRVVSFIAQTAEKIKVIFVVRIKEKADNSKIYKTGIL